MIGVGIDSVIARAAALVAADRAGWRVIRSIEAAHGGRFVFEGNMAGEIRESLGRLRRAREKMIAGLTGAMDDLAGSMAETHADGVKALELAHGEHAAIKAEINEIRDAFCATSNGGPAGPLPAGSPPLREVHVIPSSGAPQTAAPRPG